MGGGRKRGTEKRVAIEVAMAILSARALRLNGVGGGGVGLRRESVVGRMGAEFSKI